MTLVSLLVISFSSSIEYTDLLLIIGNNSCKLSTNLEDSTIPISEIPFLLDSQNNNKSPGFRLTLDFDKYAFLIGLTASKSVGY